MGCYVLIILLFNCIWSWRFMVDNFNFCMILSFSLVSCEILKTINTNAWKLEKFDSCLITKKWSPECHDFCSSLKWRSIIWIAIKISEVSLVYEVMSYVLYECMDEVFSQLRQIEWNSVMLVRVFMALAV